MSPEPFRVHLSSAVSDGIRAVVRLFAALGEGASGRADFLAADSALRWYADEWGESRFDVGELGQMRFARLGRVTVWYAVHLGRREVTIARFGFVRPRP